MACVPSAVLTSVPATKQFGELIPPLMAPVIAFVMLPCQFASYLGRGLWPYPRRVKCGDGVGEIQNGMNVVSGKR